MLKFCTNVTSHTCARVHPCNPLLHPSKEPREHSIRTRMTFSSDFLYSSSPFYHSYVEYKTRFIAQDLTRIQFESISTYHSLPGFNYQVLPKFVILIILHSHRYIHKYIYIFFNIKSYGNKANLHLKINI